MKILYLITQPDWGGAQKYVLSLAQKFDGIVLSSDQKGQLYEELDNAGVKYFKSKFLKRNINLVFDLFSIFEIRNLIRRINPDIVHINSTKAGLVGAIASKLAGRKVVFTAHGFKHFEHLKGFKRFCYIFFEKVSSWFQDFIIAVSINDFEFAQSLKTKAVFVPNGIDPIDFLERSEARSLLGLSPDELVVGVIAGLYKTKGLDLLIESIDVSRKFKIVVLGEGPERKKLQDQIKSERKEEVFLLKGHINGAPRYMKGFDIFVLPSRKEGFPFVLLEAMQAGLPIIATDVGANKYVLKDYGTLVKPNSVEALKQALNQSIEKINSGSTIINKSEMIKRAEEFDTESMFRKTSEVYDVVLNKNS
jgi:glycosyltransferase involved in cell wall biosynthesis